jgi:hypothetical protein
MNIKQRTALIFVMVLSLAILSCVTVQSIVPTAAPAQNSAMTPTNTPAAIPSPTVTPLPPFALDEAGLTINGTLIPNAAKIQDVNALFGQPSRISKLSAGTIYVFDTLGITYRTDPGGAAITNIDFYCRNDKYDFSPSQPFTQPFIIAGKAFPVCQPITEVLKTYPDVQPSSLGFIYESTFGKLKLSIYIDNATQTMNQFTIIFPTETAAITLVPGLTEWKGIPIMPGAINGQEELGDYHFMTPASENDIVNYYEQELPKSGWVLQPNMMTQVPGTALAFKKGNIFVFFKIDAQGDNNVVLMHIVQM